MSKVYHNSRDDLIVLIEKKLDDAISAETQLVLRELRTAAKAYSDKTRNHHFVHEFVL